MEIFLFFSIIIMSVMVSKICLKKHFAKKVFFYEISIFCQYLETKIKLFQTPLTTIVNVFLELKTPKEINTLLTNFVNSIKNNNQFTYESIQKYSYLNKDEQRDIFDFFSNLGKTTTDEQQKLILNNLDLFEKLKIQCDEKYASNKLLFTKLSILIGTALFVLII